MVEPRQGLRPRRSTGSVDAYLHAMLLLTDHGQPADTGDLAQRVGVTPAAASQMLRTLARQKLVRVEPFHGAELTAKGLHRALRVVRRHRLLELFLFQVMGFDLRQSHERARLMQPTIDEVFEEKLDVMLGRPKLDPHGHPIPSHDVTWPRLADTPLSDLPPGTTGRVSRVTSEDAEAIAYLAAQGVRTGARIELTSIAPFDGPVSVRIGSGKGELLHLGRRLASLVRVDKPLKPAEAETRESRERPETGPPAPRNRRRTT